MAKRPVLQFKITLQDIKPAIWRRIQISDLCTFWSLHVAIQNAMGWYDCHLHQFEVTNPKTGEEELMGIPLDEDFEISETLPGWFFKVRDYLTVNPKMIYTYDFGDNWEHIIEYEGQHEKQSGVRYPVCLDGKRRCPPEDVGSTPGYAHFLEAINDPTHEEHESMLEWVGGKFDANDFSPRKVRFESPQAHWDLAFCSEHS